MLAYDMLRYLTFITCLNSILFAKTVVNNDTIKVREHQIHSNKRKLFKKSTIKVNKKYAKKQKLPKEVAVALLVSEADQSVIKYKKLANHFRFSLPILLLSMLNMQVNYLGQSTAYSIYDQDGRYGYMRMYLWSIAGETWAGQFRNDPSLMAQLGVTINPIKLVLERENIRQYQKQAKNSLHIKKLEAASQNLELARRIVISKHVLQDLEKAHNLLYETLQANEGLEGMLENAQECSVKDVANLLNSVSRNLHEHKTRIIEAEILLQNSTTKKNAHYLVSQVDPFNSNFSINLHKFKRNDLFKEFVKNNSGYYGAKCAIQDQKNSLQKHLCSELFVFQFIANFTNQQLVYRRNNLRKYNSYAILNFQLSSKLPDGFAQQLYESQKQITETGQRYLEQRAAANNNGAKVLANLNDANQETLEQKLLLLKYINQQIELQSSFSGYSANFQLAHLLLQRAEIETAIGELISNYYKAMILSYSLYAR